MLAIALSVVVAASDGGHEVLALLDAQAAAWSRGDIESFCSIYADDAVFVSPSGVSRGRAEVLARYKKKYVDRKAMGTLKLTPIDVRSGVDEVSIVAKWELSYPDKPTVSGHTVVVFKKLEAGWRLVHDASF